MASILTVSSLTKDYGRTRALADVSFELERGKVIALLGANGSGKSTLIKSIVGLLHFEGSVLLDGIDVSRHGKAARARVGYLAQQPALHPDLTVRETAQFYADLRGVAHERARALVESVGLEQHFEKEAGALSGGMRQRLALAIALLGDPPLLVLDEPAAGLDISARLELRHVVREQRERGTAILLSTHWLEDVPYMADDALLLDEGHCIFLGPATELPGIVTPNARLYLRVNDGRAEALPLLRKHFADAPVDSSGDWLVVSCRPDEKARVVKTLIGAGITILDLRVEEATVDAAPAVARIPS